jgi:hypothetical protein
MADTNEDLNEKSRQDPSFNPRDALWNQQKDMFSSRLQERAKQRGVQNYDQAELQDIERWVRADENSGKDASPILEQSLAKIDQRFPNQPSGSNSGSGQQSSGNYVSPSSNNNSGSNVVRDTMTSTQTSLEPQLRAQRDALYNTLMTRAGQGLDVNSDNPVIRRQADTYSAAQERAMQRYLANEAEAQGPYANLGSERLKAAEQFGQSSASFEAALMAKEIEARRQEIKEALSGMQGLLTTDQQLQLQRQLGLLNDMVQNRQVDVAGQNANTNLMQALMQNDQFYNNLGLTAADRASYWDAVRKGLL